MKKTAEKTKAQQAILHALKDAPKYWLTRASTSQGPWGTDYSVSKHKNLKEAERAMEKFRPRTLIHRGTLRIDKVETSSAVSS